MAVATSMLIAAGISAGVQAYAKHKEAKTAEKAANTLSTASTTAADDTRQQTMRALDYMNAARQTPGMPAGPAQTYLTRLMGVPGSNPAATPLPPRMPGALPSGYQALFGQSPDAPPAPGPAVARQRAPGGGMVMIQAPDGETRAMPEALAQRALAMGGKRVG